MFKKINGERLIMAYQDWKNIDTSEKKLTKTQFIAGSFCGFLFLVFMGFVATWG